MANDIAALLRWLEGNGCGCGCEEKEPPKPLPDKPPAGPAFRSAAAPPALPVIPAAPIDEPFVPPAPSWDSPQRPGLWGAPHTPVAPEGRFNTLGPGAESVFRPWPVMEDGTLHTEEYIGIHHDRNAIRGQENIENAGFPPLPAGLILPAHGGGVTWFGMLYANWGGLPTRAQHRFTVTPEWLDAPLPSPENIPGERMVNEIAVMQFDEYFSGGRGNEERVVIATEARTITPATLTWPAGTTLHHYRSAYRSYLGYRDSGYYVTSSTALLALITTVTAVPENQLEWVEFSLPGLRKRWYIESASLSGRTLTQTFYVGIGEDQRQVVEWGRKPPKNWDPNVIDWTLDWRDATPTPTLRIDLGPEEQNLFLVSQFESRPELTPVPNFISPDGQVIARGTQLTAYGRTFPLSTLGSGSWSACRDADGETVILHEKEGTITALRGAERVETCTREEFETGVLRMPAGSFLRFGSEGQSHHAWPDTCAIAHMNNRAALAVTGEVPWRDRLKAGTKKDPPAWVWRGRPAKPAPAPPTLPRPPLGLTLADFMSGVTWGELAHADPWPKAVGPAQLPVSVVLGEDEEPNAEALTALAKRFFYPPAQWPEELDDRTNVPLNKGVLVTFTPLPLDTEEPRQWLMLRAKVSKGTPEEVLVQGMGHAMHRLGHNALAPRGWHPYVVQLLEPLANEQPLHLRAPFPISRLLLVTRPRTTLDGGGPIQT